MNELQTGQLVLASDGMSPWEPAKILSGPHQELTSEGKMYLIEYVRDHEIFLAYAGDLRRTQRISVG